jgi:hypothetical protein
VHGQRGRSGRKRICSVLRKRSLFLLDWLMYVALQICEKHDKHYQMHIMHDLLAFLIFLVCVRIHAVLLSHSLVSGSCNSGYFGAACASQCPGGALSPCSGRGLCGVDGACACLAGSVGAACQYACPIGPGGGGSSGAWSEEAIIAAKDTVANMLNHDSIFALTQQSVSSPIFTMLSPCLENNVESIV